MTVQLLGAIHRFQGQSGDSKPSDATVPVGSQFYEVDTTDTYVWDGSDWTVAPAFNGLFMPTANEKDALDGAAAPASTNVFVTAADVVDLPTADQKDALDGAATPSAANVFVTAADVVNLPTTAEKAFLDAVPTTDPGDGVTIWADTGVLKIASGP